MTDTPQWAQQTARARHGLTLDYAGGTGYGAPLLARCTAPGCGWQHAVGRSARESEPLALTSYFHWLHQLDELRDVEIRAEVARERHQA